MKNPTAKQRRSETNYSPVAKTVEEYLSNVPEPARSTLDRLRRVIRSAMPPGTIEVITYRIPTFKYTRPLIGFAAFPKHCSLFVMSGSLLDRFASELKSYSTSKGTIRFLPDKPLPPQLVKKLVKARLAENDSGK